jgi:methionyl-tRNA synthetase
MSRFYITTPIYYVNAAPHLGHTYSTIVADVVTRFHRQLGEAAAFLTGTDEHGQKVERAATAAGISPQEWADRYAALFRAQWDRMGLDYSYFIRTTEPRHAAAVWELFRRVKENGYVYKGTYTGPYCVFDELFVGEGEPGSPCPECGRPTESVTEENYFFKLSAFQDRLLQLYEERPDFIRPEVRRNEVLSFVHGGLRDLSISRTSLRWGIPVPGDEKHVFYVWFDALTAYLSGIGFGSEHAADRQRFEELWPGWHLIGKEIVRFHCVYWPAFLMAAGLPLPRGIIGHGWLLFEEEKMSKSRGNVVKAEPIRQVLGADALRYYLLREISFGNDGSFSYDSLVARHNSDLANDWGNLASRTLTMIGRYFEGRIPYPSAAASWTRSDLEIIRYAEAARDGLVSAFKEYQFSRGLEAVWQLIAAVNRYLVEGEPWALADRSDNESRSRLATILHIAAEALRFTAVLLFPVTPKACESLWGQLGMAGTPNIRVDALHWGAIPVDQKIGKAEPLFPRLEKEATVEKLRMLEAESGAAESGAAAIAAPAPADASRRSVPPAAETAPAKPAATTPSTRAEAADGRIAIEDFARVDMRVGEVKTAERIKGADKLLKLTVDIGSEVRQIVAGIAESYAPESLVGRKVVIVANLQPRKLRGVESDGMIVAAAVGEKGTPVLVSVAQDTPNGSRLR